MACPIHLCRGLLHTTDSELIDHEPGADHSWLIWVDDDDVASICDPTILQFFREHGVPLGLRWELPPDWTDAESRQG